MIEKNLQCICEIIKTERERERERDFERFCKFRKII